MVICFSALPLLICIGLLQSGLAFGDLLFGSAFGDLCFGTAFKYNNGLESDVDHCVSSSCLKEAEPIIIIKVLYWSTPLNPVVEHSTLLVFRVVLRLLFLRKEYLKFCSNSFLTREEFR